MGCASQKAKTEDEDKKLVEDVQIKKANEEKPHSHPHPHPEETKSQPLPPKNAEPKPKPTEEKKEQSQEENMSFLITVWDFIKALLVLMRAALGRKQMVKIMMTTTEDLNDTLGKLKEKNIDTPKEQLNNLMAISTQVKEFCEKAKKAKASSKSKSKTASKYKTNQGELKEIAKFNELLDKSLKQLKNPLEKDIEEEKKNKMLAQKAEELSKKMDDTLKNLEENDIKVVGLAQNDLSNEEAFEFWVQYFPDRYIVPAKEFSSKFRIWIKESKGIELSNNNLDVTIRLMNRQQIPGEEIMISAKEVNTFLEHLPIDVDWDHLVEIEKEVAEDQEKRIAEVNQKRKEDEAELTKRINAVRSEETQEEKDLVNQNDFTRFLTKGSWFITQDARTEFFVRNVFIDAKNGEIKVYGKDQQGEFKMEGQINYTGQFNMDKSYVGNEERIAFEGLLQENDMDGTLALIGSYTEGDFMICMDINHWFGYYLQGGAKDMQVCFKVVEEKMTGVSLDEVGAAVWFGTIDESELHMVKQYIDKHSVNYDGKITKNGTVTEIKGKWDIQGYTGGFLLSHNDEEVD